MSTLRNILLTLAALLSVACGATGDIAIDVIQSNGQRKATLLPRTPNYFLGLDASGNVVVKAGGGGGGTGTVTSVGVTVPTGLAVSGSPITSSGTFGITYASGYQGYTSAEASKLSGIASGAEVNVNADWNAGSGDAQILNKPTLGTMAAETATNYLTTATAASTYVSLSGSYSNPTWITGLAWSKISGAPSFLTANETITLSGAVTGSGTNAITTTLAANQARDNLTGGSGTLNLSSFTLTLPADVTLLGSSIDLASEVTGSLPWASVSKSGSSLADLATRSAGDLTSGTLPDARFPATLPAISGANLTSLDPYDLQQRGATDGQAMIWSTANSRWEPGTVSGAGTPGGSDTQVQFNDGGAFGAEDDFYYNKTTNTLVVNGAISGASLAAGSSGSVSVAGLAGPSAFGQAFLFPGRLALGWKDASNDQWLATIKPPSSLTADIDLELPGSSGTLALVAHIPASLADLATRSAGDLTSGTLPDARFPSTLPALSGVNLTALNASNLSSGTVPGARLPVPTTTVLGGVMRNTGTGGQFVNGINSVTGALEYGTPAGAGTVTSVGGTGTVNGLTLTGTVTSSGNLALGGTLSGTASGLTAGNVTTNANLTGPVTSVGNATTITDAAVTLAKLANLAQDQFIGRVTASTGVPETATITAAARTVLDDTTVGAMLTTMGGAPLASPTFTGTVTLPSGQALVAPALGTPVSGNFGSGSFTWPTFNQSTTGNAATVTTNANLTGPVTSVGNATAIANGAITNAMLANAAVANLSGTNSGDNAANSSSQPVDAQLTSLAALAYAGNTLKVVRVNAAETDFELATIAAGGGDAVAQIVATTSKTAASTTSSFPIDNTIPQNTEGAEYTSLNTTITPSNASSTLLVEVVMEVSASVAIDVLVCLFRDSAADAVAVRDVTVANTSWSSMAVLTYKVSAGSTSATTFKVRYGCSPGTHTAYIGRWNGTYWGAQQIASMTVTEILP
jgi:hypothetical protein